LVDIITSQDRLAVERRDPNPVLGPDILALEEGLPDLVGVKFPKIRVFTRDIRLRAGHYGSDLKGLECLGKVLW
jgi:hypothetical protein